MTRRHHHERQKLGAQHLQVVDGATFATIACLDIQHDLSTSAATAADLGREMLQPGAHHGVAWPDDHGTEVRDASDARLTTADPSQGAG